MPAGVAEFVLQLVLHLLIEVQKQLGPVLALPVPLLCAGQGHAQPLKGRHVLRHIIRPGLLQFPGPGIAVGGADALYAAVFGPLYIIAPVPDHHHLGDGRVPQIPQGPVYHMGLCGPGAVVPNYGGKIFLYAPKTQYLSGPLLPLGGGHA